MPVQMTSETARTVKNVEKFQEEFRRYTNAAIGLIVIRTREPKRCCDALQMISIKKEERFRLWACNKGWQDFPNVRPGDDDVIDVHRPLPNNDLATVDIAKAFQLILDRSNAASLDGNERGAVYVMYYPHHHFDKPLIQQYIKDFVIESRERPVRLAMIVPDSVKIPSEIEDDLHVMDFGAPSHAELQTCYDEFVETLPEELKPQFDEDDVTVLVQNGLGMTYSEFETALALAVVTFASAKDKDKSLLPEYTKLLLSHKTEIIKKTDLLELMPSENMDSVGGFDVMKAWLKLRSKAYSEEARSYGINVPRGMLCVGPPGSGKSLFAKATASAFQVPLVKFDIGKVFGKFVGESEGRIRSAIKIIEAMAPCVLLVDEIDKGFGGLSGGGSDGGTSMRVLGSFLNWMQDRDTDKNPVFIVMTANNVIGLPPELMRRGRIDEIFACTFPGHSERKEILNIHLTKRGHKLANAELDAIASETDKYVGAELEGAIENALLEAYDQELEHPTADIIIAQAKGIVPMHKAFADKINHMHEWAKNNAKPASSAMTFDQTAVSAAGKGTVRRINVPKTPAKGRNLDG